MPAISRLLLRLISLALLCLGTILFSVVSDRYVETGETLIHNPRLLHNQLHWQSQDPNSVSVTNGTMSLSSPAVPKVRATSVSQTIIIPSTQRLLVMSSEVRAIGVVAGKKPWEKARVALFPLTPENKLRYDVPHTLVALEGTTPWKRYEQVFCVPEENTAVSVVIQLLNASGTLEVRSISLKTVIENPVYMELRHTLIMVWLIAGPWIVWPLLREASNAKGRIWILLTSGIILIGALMPASVKFAITPFWLLPETEAPGPFRADLLPATVPFGLELLPTDLGIYKLAHFLLFAIIGYLLIAKRPYAIPVRMQTGMLALLALATETMQVLASGRGGSLGDVVIDMSGVCCGMLIAAIMHHRFGRESNSC